MSNAPTIQRWRGTVRRLARLTTLALVFGLPASFDAAAPANAAAQEAQGPTDLATMFELGNLVLDTNGDSVPDRVNASLVLGDSPSVTATAAAAEIAARLGFETMAMDLPIARGVAGDAIPIVIGRGGLSASGLASPGVDPTSLDAGEGVVAIRDFDGRTWILVLGGDDEGLLAAARLFSGVLPHTRTLSTANLSRVRDDLAAALEAEGVENTQIVLTQARARTGRDGVARLVADVSAETPDVDAIARALRKLADAATSLENADPVGNRTPLAYAGLGSVEARIAGGPAIRLEGARRA